MPLARRTWGLVRRHRGRASRLGGLGAGGDGVVPGAMFGPETFVERVGDDALAKLATAATLHRLGYRGLRAKGLKGRHIEALVAHWRRQGLSDGTVKNRMAHLRWLAKKIGKPGIVRRDNASYGVGARCAT